jgi:hypothetical protein
MRVHVAEQPTSVPPGVPVLDLIEFRRRTPLLSWSAVVRSAQDRAYRMACEGTQDCALVGPGTYGYGIRRQIRAWAKHYGFSIEFYDRRTS